MKEIPDNKPESGEIDQQQAKRFVDTVERIDALFGAPFSFAEGEAPVDELGKDRQAEFVVDDIAVRVVIGEINYEDIDRKAWNVFLDAAAPVDMYLQEQFEVSKDESGAGLGVRYAGVVWQWDDGAERYKEVHSARIQALIEEFRDRAADPKALSDSSRIGRLSAQTINTTDREIEAATGLDLNRFTPERFTRVMGLLARCNEGTLVKE